MWKSICVASTFGVAFLSIGSALAADPTMDVPPGAPPVEGAPPRPMDPDHLMPPAPPTTTTESASPTTTTEVIPPSTSAATAPPMVVPTPAAGYYPDARDN